MGWPPIQDWDNGHSLLGTAKGFNPPAKTARARALLARATGTHRKRYVGLPVCHLQNCEDARDSRLDDRKHIKTYD